MAAAVILKIGLMAISRSLCSYIVRNYAQGLKTTSYFAVKIHFPQNPRWGRFTGYISIAMAYSF